MADSSAFKFFSRSHSRPLAERVGCETSIRPTSANRSSGRWKRRLLNAFALVALPTAVLPSAGFAEDGVVKIGRGSAPAVQQADFDGSSDEGRATVQKTQFEPGPTIAAPAGAPPAAGTIPAGEMPPATVSPVSPQPMPASNGGYSASPVESAPFVSPYTPTAPQSSVVGVPQATAGSSFGYSMISDPADVLYNVGRRSGDILGIDDGFTHIGAYIPFVGINDTSHLFFNPRALITDQGRGGVNLGGGYRWYNGNTNRTNEASLWYDYDDGAAEKYTQVGLHLASYGDYWTYRAGGNFVVGEELNQLGTVGLSNARLSGNNILTTQTLSSEAAFNRYYGEMEVPVRTLNAFGGTTAVGGYYLRADDASMDTFGVSVRAEAQVTEDAWVNVIYTHDEIFDSNVSVNFNITLPDARPSRYFRKPRARDMMYSQTRRPYRVATKQFQSTVDAATINPKDGQPFEIAFIDPNAVDGGNGSVDTPFGSTADYMSVSAADRASFDTIVVGANDLTQTFIDPVSGAVLARTRGQDLDTSVTLLDCQAIVGESGLGSFLSATLGFANLDTGTVSASMLPLLNNQATPSEDVITLIGGGHTVAGLQIDAGGTANGIVGNNQTDGFTIVDNFFTNFQQGVLLAHTGDGRGVITGNRFDGNGIGEAVGVGGAGFGAIDGIRLTHTGGQLDLLIANNQLTDIAGEDRNGNGVLDPSEDLDGDGVLDTGEDLNGNGVLDLAEDVNGNAATTGNLPELGNAIVVEATGAGTILNAGDAITNPLAPVGITGNVVGVPGEIGSGSQFGITVNALDQSVVELVEAGNTVVGGVTAAGVIDPGYVLNADNATMDVFDFSGNIALGVGGTEDGGQFTASNGGTITFDDGSDATSAFDNNIFGSNGGNGLIVVADGAGSRVSFDQIQSNAFGVASVNRQVLANGVVADVPDATGNGLDGLRLIARNDGAIAVDNPLSGNTFVGNQGNGLAVRAETGGTFIGDLGFQGADATGAPITLTNTFTDNLLAGISLEAGAGSVLQTAVQNLTLTDNTGGGLRLVADGGVLDVQAFQNNDLSGNGTFGAALIVNDGGQLILPGISGNDFSDNTQAGLLIAGEDTGAPSPAGTLVLDDVVNNQFNRVAVDPATGLPADTIGTGFFGIQFDTQNVNVSGTLLSNNFIAAGANVENNPLSPGFDVSSTGPGIGGRVEGGGLNLTLGGVEAVDRNTFIGNGDAHIGLVLAGDSQNTIVINKHIFDGAVDADPTAPFASTRFDGDGVGFVLQDSATLTGSITNSQITNNESDGVFISVGGDNMNGGPGGNGVFGQLNNFVIGGPGSPRLDPLTANNTVTGNGDNGLRIERTDNGTIENLLITGNQVDMNGGSGLVVDVSTTNNQTLVGGVLVPNPDTITVTNNTFNMNGQGGANPIALGVGAGVTPTAGATLVARADAEAIVNFDMNEFVSNNGEGILVVEQALDSTDLRGINGLWTNNVVTDNGLDGIAINGAGEIQIGTVGSGNQILRNASDGIEITSAADVVIEGNLIARSGIGTTDLLDIDGEGVNFSQIAGIDIDALAVSSIEISNNVITENFGDGIEYRNISNGGVGDLTAFDLLIEDNEISFNDGRGVDYLLTGEGQGIIGGSTAAGFDLRGNFINSNRLQGVYVVATSAAEQLQNNAASEAMSIDSVIDTEYYLRFNALGNEVGSNGIDVVSAVVGGGLDSDADETTGLVLRVGTTGGGYGFTQTGGFVSDGAGNFITGTANGQGGIISTISGNTLAGNFGNDIFIESFRSTVQPVMTAGQWSDTMFNVTNYDGDALARLDLSFSNNTIAAADITNVGAFYNNTEGTFKSRVIGGPTNPEPGPFVSGIRDRAAQRLAIREYPPEFPNAPFVLNPNPDLDGSAAFLYAGMGDSTFRIDTTNSDSLQALQTLTGETSFIFDDSGEDFSPIESPFERNGFIRGGRPNQGIDPAIYGWGTF